MRVISVLLAVSLSFPAASAKHPADLPISLSEAQSFEAPLLSEVSHDEIADARRAMASAVSAEKFVDGVKTVLFIALIVYLAWPDGGSSSSTVSVQQTPATTAGGGM